MSYQENFEVLKTLLSTKKNYPENIVNVPNTALLNTACVKDLIFFMEYFGAEFDKNSSYFAVKTEDGLLAMLYGPSVVRNSQGRAVIRFDRSTEIDLDVVKNTEGVDLSIDESNLTIFLPPTEEDPDGQAFVFPVRYNEPNLSIRTAAKAQYVRALKNSNTSLAAFLAEPKNGVYFMKMSELEENSTYRILDYKENINETYGLSYFLKLEGIDPLVATNSATTKQLNLHPTNDLSDPDQAMYLLTTVKRTTKGNKVTMNATISGMRTHDLDAISLDW